MRFFFFSDSPVFAPPTDHTYIYIYQQRNVLQTSHSNKAPLEDLPCTRTITFETLYKPSEIFVIHFYMVLFVSVYVSNSQFVYPASFLFLFPC